MNQQALHVRDNRNDSCYEAVVDDQVVGIVVYKRDGNRLVIRHTMVAPELRGDGVGTNMVRAVLDDVRERGEKLTNYCGFVADFLDDHTGYQDLIDTDRPGVTLPRDKRGKGSSTPAIYQ
jgi:uncharacterized protein